MCEKYKIIIELSSYLSSCFSLLLKPIYHTYDDQSYLPGDTDFGHRDRTTPLE